MKLPDGMVYVFSTDRKGTGINIESRELITCKNCKYCVNGLCFGISFLRCEQNKDAMREVDENDWCCWAEKEDE